MQCPAAAPKGEEMVHRVLWCALALLSFGKSSLPEEDRPLLQPVAEAERAPGLTAPRLRRATQWLPRRSQGGSTLILICPENIFHPVQLELFISSIGDILLFFCCECNAEMIASSSELPVDAV